MSDKRDQTDEVKGSVEDTKRRYKKPTLVEVDLAELDNVITCACSADDLNPY